MMLKNIKPGSGKYPGEKYQRWVGVKLICEWFIESLKNPTMIPYLEEEVGQKNAGIFDDILMHKDSTHYFYQIKHTISLIGDTIKLIDLTNSNSKIFIQKMYDAYNKIKTNYNPKHSELIIYTNKSLDSSLKPIISKNGCFDKNFIKGTLKKEIKKRIRREFFKLCDEPEDFKKFLSHINFHYSSKDPENEAKKLTNLPTESLRTIYNLVDRTTKSKYKVSYNTPVLLRLFQKERTYEQEALKIGIYSKKYLPQGEEFDYSLDLFSSNSESMIWKKVEDEIYNLKKEIEDTSEIRFLEIHAKTHLTIGFLLGFIFRKTTGFFLSIQQLDEIWLLSKKPKGKFLKENIKIINKKSRITVIRINIGDNDVKNPVMKYLNENNINPNNLIDFEYKKMITKNEISSIINQIIKKIKRKLKDTEEIHFFGAFPLGMAVFLGYNCNALPLIYLYEYDNKNRKYVQSYVLEQS